MDKRESLLSRYKRILGRSPRETDDEPLRESPPDSQPSSSRRREQVLQAQRTHRNRTQQYIRDLEKEVLKLRSENEGLLQGMERMRAEMSEMDALLVQHGLKANDSTVSNIQQQAFSRPAWDVDSSSDPSTITTVDLTALASVSPQGACMGDPADIIPPPYQPRAATTSATHVTSSDPSTSLPSQSQSPQDDHLTTQVGINFILALEAPCLPHIKYAHMGSFTGTWPESIPDNSGTSHLLAASSTLVHRYKDADLEHAPINVPSAEIERLLEASAQLKLDGEVTPVQIWQQIKTGWIAVQEGLIAVLISELSKYVYCNSFGAVVQKDTADYVLADLLGPTQI